MIHLKEELSCGNADRLLESLQGAVHIRLVFRGLKSVNVRRNKSKKENEGGEA
jgi:hypothetical protein